MNSFDTSFDRKDRHNLIGQRVVDLIQYAKEILEQYHDQL
jgi:hypothetical protein